MNDIEIPQENALKKVPQGAEELVATWTRGLSVVAELVPQKDLYIVVAKDDGGRYHVTTFFPKVFMPGWNVSGDAQRKDADTAFKALERPVKASVPKGAEEIVETWLRGLSVVAEISHERDLYIAVAKDDRGNYHVTTFFPKGFMPGWNVSGDARGVDADTAFQALERRMNPL